VNMTFWVWLSVGIYIALGMAIAIAARRHLGAGMNEFFLGNRRVGGFVSAMTYAATTYSAFMMIGLAGLTYKSGVGALGFELTYLCGLFLVAFFGPRFWLVGRKFDYLTHAELLADRYQSKAVGVTACALCFIFLVPYAAIQIMGIGYLVAGLSKGAIPLIAGMIVAIVLGIAWSNIAGLRSVAWTDAFQALVMVGTSLAVLLVVVQAGFGGFGDFFARMNSDIPDLLTVPTGKGLWNVNMFIGLALPWLFFSLSNPQVTQRLFIPKSVTAFKQMIGGFLIFGFIYTLISVLWGFAARLLVPGLENADMATPTLLAMPIVPMALALLVMVGIMAAAISTIDSILLTLSSMWARDVHKSIINPRISGARELAISRKCVIPIIAIISFVFAWWAAGKTGLAFMIAPLSSAASAGLLMAVPTIIAAFFWRRATAAGALSSMIVGAIIVLVLQVINFKPLGLWPAVWGAIACVILFVAVSLLTRPPLEKANEFMGYLQGELQKGNFV